MTTDTTMQLAKYYVDTIDNLPDRVSTVDEDEMPFVYRSTVEQPIEWDQNSIESALSISIPPLLKAIWNLTSRFRIYEEVNFGQWGLISCSPAEIVEFNLRIKGLVPRFWVHGDLIVSEFRGDSHLLVLRADSAKEDYGQVIISESIYPREDWTTVAASLDDFLEKFLKSTDKYYWT
ncbi:SMI1/KNR4 family protein [bacterium]|nr:SMI1/KNR4 family protein [bacterium]